MTTDVISKEDLENKIVRLSAIWYEYVGMDHHKDRDCHWMINKTYSYGRPATYVVSHHGYIGSDWQSKPVDNEYDAMLLLISRLNLELTQALKYAKRGLEEAKSEEFSWYEPEHYEKMIAILEKR